MKNSWGLGAGARGGTAGRRDGGFGREYGVLTPEDWVAVETLRSEVGRLTWRLYTVVSRQATEQSIA
jgi:hypothetical protein